MVFRTAFLATLLSMLLAIPCFAKDPLRTIEGIVTKVSDSDTIQVTDSLAPKSKFVITASIAQKPRRATVGQVAYPKQDNRMGKRLIAPYRASYSVSMFG